LRAAHERRPLDTRLAIRVQAGRRGRHPLGLRGRSRGAGGPPAGFHARLRASRRYALPAVDPLFEFALSIKAIQREIERRTNEVLQPLGVTAAQADALAVIAQAGPVSLGELGDLLIAEGGHPSRLVDRLVEAGLVERRAADSDRRRIELSLTARGRRLERK